MSGDTLAALAVALGASWASGLNPYAAVLVMGGAQMLGLVSLPHDLQVLGSPWVLAAAAVLFALNFLADKIPLVDSLNDVLHTFVRIPAGALLAFGAADQLGPEVGDHRRAARRHAGGGQPHRQDRHARADQHLARAVQQHRRLICRGQPGDRRADPGARPSDHFFVPAGALRGGAGLAATKARASGADAVPPHGALAAEALKKTSIRLRSRYTPPGNMFIRQNIQTLRFFRTTPAMRCPYLPHRLETKLVTELSGPDAISQHDTLTDAGFRRSHHFVYKPLCDGCRACVPVRIRVRDFDPNRVQRRIMKRNEHVHATEVQALATGEQYSLFSRYVMARHRDGDMADMDFDDYRAMVEESPVETAIIEFRDDSADGKLVGACLVDWLSSGVSAVYSYFDPQDPRRGLGTYMILWLAEAAAKRGLPYVYLGYWIADSSKMAYKRAFRPLEFFGAEGWTELPTT